MIQKNSNIFLNDILRLDNIDNVKIRFNTMFRGSWNPIEYFQSADKEVLLEGQYWNFKRNRSYKEGQITLGFIRLNSDLWLLFHVGRVTKDLNIFDGVGYEYETLSEYEKYFGRLIIKFKNKSQAMIRLANPLIEECEVVQILPNIFDNDIFPGYDKVKVSWKELSRVVEKEGWRTALENQKGVYLITNTLNGRMYVGSAYGKNMILGRWKSYIATGHGGNYELKKIILEDAKNNFEYIKNNFEYSILEIFKSTTDDKNILAREIWWKSILKTREFGYNKN